MTLAEAKNLKFGQTIYYRLANNADGTMMRYKVNGAVKTWKKSPERVQVPLKRGLREYGYLTEANLDWFEL